MLQIGKMWRDAEGNPTKQPRDSTMSRGTLNPKPLSKSPSTWEAVHCTCRRAGGGGARKHLTLQSAQPLDGSFREMGDPNIIPQIVGSLLI